MSVGLGLLKSVIENRSPLSELREGGIEESDFLGSEREAYRFLRDFYMQYGAHPTLETLIVETGIDRNINSLPSEPVSFWVSRVKNRSRFNSLSAGFGRINTMFSEDTVDRTIQEIGDLYNSVRDTYTDRRAVPISRLESEVIELHDRRQSFHEVMGVTFGFPFLDAISGGVFPGDVITLAGRPGVGKSFLAMKMAVAAEEAGHNVLFCSPEMRDIQTARRHLGLKLRINVNDMKFGRLSYYARETLADAVHIDVGNWFRLLPSSLNTSIEDIELAVYENRPDVLYIDGAYLLTTSGGSKNLARWDRIMHIYERIKHLSMIAQVPIITTVQLNKKLDVAFSDGINQLSSIVMRCEFEREEDSASTALIQSRLLRIVKGRDGETGILRLLFGMDRTEIRQDRVVVGNLASLDSTEREALQHQDDPDDAEAFEAL